MRPSHFSGLILHSFNTDNGIRRATIRINTMSTSGKAGRFNTDNGIRRATILDLHTFRKRRRCFNTDNGIRRATIVWDSLLGYVVSDVSIPTTVSGGLQSSRR